MPNYFNDLADIGDDEVGWNPFKRRRRAKRGATRSVPARRLLSKVPGVPARGLGDQSLGFGTTAFTAASGTSLNLVGTSYRPFRGRRLVIDVTRTGVTATGILTVTRLDVGADNQLPGPGAIPVAGFAATAFGVNLDMDPAYPSIPVTLTINTSAAPGGADRIDVAAMLIGESVR